MVFYYRVIESVSAHQYDGNFADVVKFLDSIGKDSKSIITQAANSDSIVVKVSECLDLTCDIGDWIVSHDSGYMEVLYNWSFQQHYKPA